jgi:hypothetical protein
LENQSSFCLVIRHSSRAVQNLLTSAATLRTNVMPAFVIDAHRAPAQRFQAIPTREEIATIELGDASASFVTLPPKDRCAFRLEFLKHRRLDRC